MTDPTVPSAATVRSDATVPLAATYDLVVVGAGLMGACTAWAAGRRGLRAAVLERFEPGHAHGSSHGTSRIFRRAYGDPFYVELTARAAESWDRLEDDTGAVLRSFTGGLDHGRARDPQRLAQLLARASVPHALLSAEAAGERWPHLVFTTDVLHHPDAGVLDADLTVTSALAAARRRGVAVQLRTDVTSIVPAADGAVVHAADEDGGQVSFAARRVVLAAGPWNQRWLPAVFGPSAPRLTVTQQQVVHFRQRGPAVLRNDRAHGADALGRDHDEWKSSLTFDGLEPEKVRLSFHSPSPPAVPLPGVSWPVVVHKDAMQVFVVPAGRAAPGAIKIGEHDQGTVTTADQRDGVVDPRAVERLTRYVAQFLPTLVPEPFAASSCLYTTTPSEDFVIDAAGPLIVCSPCSGHGAKFAPYVGELVTAMAVGDTEPPRRFTIAAHQAGGSPSLPVDTVTS